MHRRAFLGASAALAAGFALPASSSGQEAAVWLGARVDAAGLAHATRFDAAGRVRFDVALPARGHGAAYFAARAECVVVSRRPGDFLLVVSARDGSVRYRVPAAPERFFNGHAEFARGLLFATETVATDIAPGQGNGVLGVYDPARGYARIGEFPTGGHDPHQLIASGDELVVANGGLLTHPDAPGVKLNIDSMDSSLVRIDARDGRIVDAQRLAPELHQLGLRHVARRADGTVAVVMQYEGPSVDDVPLIALHRPGASLVPVELPHAVQSRLRNYCGSVAFDRSGRVLGVTSPKGGIAVFWDVEEERLAGTAEVDDGCGIAAATERGMFVVTSGLGGARRCDGTETVRVAGDPRIDASHWDNHLIGA